MSFGEREIREATSVFDEAIYGIRDSGVDRVAKIAGRVVEKIRGRDILIIGNNEEFLSPSVTGFRLIHIPDPSREIYMGGIVLDVPSMLSAGVSAVRNDLVRSLGVAEQFPLSGFERRLAEVYEDAFGLQANWLNAMKVVKVDLDPRVENHDDLRRKLLGDVWYYMGFGLKDWKEAIERRKRGGVSRSEREALEMLANSAADFVSRRERIINMPYFQNQFKMKRSIVESTPQEKLIRTAADSMVIATLATRPLGRNN